MDAGQEAVDRGKQVAQDAMQTAKDSGQEHAQEMREQVCSQGTWRAGGAPAPPGSPQAARSWRSTYGRMPPWRK